MSLRALVRVNLAAIERNAARLRAGLTGDSRLCAVVKARASGHGAVAAARAALAGGADWLAVATAEEAAELRVAGLAVPILIMGPISAEELPVALGARANVVAWDRRFVDEVRSATAAGRAGVDEVRSATPAQAPIGIHVKLDTGMGRLGTRSLTEALDVADRVRAAGPALHLVGAMTHFATADSDPEFLAAQLGTFAPFAAAMRRRGPIVVHAANSAATLRDPASHLDMVRCGIALHGCDPFNADPDGVGLEPALELTSYVAALKPARAGESAGYGRRFVAGRDTWIATVPIGYADGARRDLSGRLEVLIGGRRYPQVGTVSMDSLTVDAGPQPSVVVGDPVVLIGRSGSERQTVEDLANLVGTINHEVLCGISERVPRRYHRDGEPAG